MSGEKDNESDIKTWMTKNELFLSDDTYTKLKNAQFKSMDDIRQCSTTEMTHYADKLGIAFPDISKLNRGIEKLSNKKTYVDVETINVFKSMDLKISQFQNSVNRLGTKQKTINQQKEKIESEINNAFDIISQKVNERKQMLLEKLTDITNKKNELMKNKIKEYNNTLNNIQNIQQNTKKLIDSVIDIDEFKDKKLKIAENQKTVVKMINDNNSKYDKIKINDQINFVMDVNEATKFISHLGRISDMNVPILSGLEYDNNNPNGKIKVCWMLNVNNEQKENDNDGMKILIEYGIIDANNENDIDEKQCMSHEINIDNQTSEGMKNIEIDEIGVYLFKLRCGKGNIWSAYSNIKSIKITDIKIIIESNILTDDEKKKLINLIKPALIQQHQENNISITLSLLYRMSRDGNGSPGTNFHLKCNNKGATISVVHTKHNHVCGGYASIPWTSSGNTKRDDYSFLYLLRSQFGHKPEIFKVKNNQGPRHYKTDGASFGDGATLRIYGDKPNCYVRSESTYTWGWVGNSLCGGDQYITTKTLHNFEIQDYEVFQVSVCK